MAVIYASANKGAVKTMLIINSSYTDYLIWYSYCTVRSIHCIYLRLVNKSSAPYNTPVLESVYVTCIYRYTTYTARSYTAGSTTDSTGSGFGILGDNSGCLRLTYLDLLCGSRNYGFCYSTNDISTIASFNAM